MGMINQISIEGNKVIIKDTKYFRKWVEAIQLKSSKVNKIIYFLVENIIIEFGVSSSFLVDNGTNFKGKT